MGTLLPQAIKLDHAQRKEADELYRAMAESEIDLEDAAYMVIGLRDQRNVLLESLRMIAEEPFGPSDASHATVLHLITEFAKQKLIWAARP